MASRSQPALFFEKARRNGSITSFRIDSSKATQDKTLSYPLECALVEKPGEGSR